MPVTSEILSELQNLYADYEQKYYKPDPKASCDINHLEGAMEAIEKSVEIVTSYISEEEH